MNNLQTKHKHYNLNYKIYTCTWSISDIAVLTADILDKQIAFFTWLTGSSKSQRKSQPKSQPKLQVAT
jgi:hypothetical protein